MYTISMSAFDWENAGTDGKDSPCESLGLAEVPLDDGHTLAVNVRENTCYHTFEIEGVSVVNADNEIVRYVNPHLIRLVRANGAPVNATWGTTWNTLTVVEVADLFGRSVETVKQACQEGLVPGARKAGRVWLLPYAAAAARWGAPGD